MLRQILRSNHEIIESSLPPWQDRNDSFKWPLKKEQQQHERQDPTPGSKIGPPFFTGSSPPRPAREE
jgi:hypothetical protein